MVETTKPTVSVVIPCYNLGAYLDQAVQSVLDQTFQDFEIIVIDDGSTDAATRYLFTSYGRPKTRILRTPNQGLAKARNLGIEQAWGRYISCLDADDLLEPDFLARTVEVLEADPSLAFVSCWLKAFGDQNFEWSPNGCDFPWLLVEDTVCTAALTRRAALVEVGGFDSGMPVAGYEDWDLAISLVERGLGGTVIPEYLFRYRIRQSSMSSSCTAPGNHALLMRYLVEKHAESYSRFLPGVLETIEKRTLELCALAPSS
jgi:glycosyltransferase involved in cell wall biosynthesis